VPRGWRRAIAAGAILAAVGASAYLWWWRPLMLATLKVGLERAIAGVKSGPGMGFQSLDLAGLNTLVLKNVSIGTMDDPASAVIREVRLTFDLAALVRGRLDWTRALRAVRLVEPQATVTMPITGPAKANRLPVLGPPRGASLDITRGRVLLRSGISKADERSASDRPRASLAPGASKAGGAQPKVAPGASKAGGAQPKVAPGAVESPVTVIPDIEVSVVPAGNNGYDFSASLTAPASPRHGVRARGTYVPAQGNSAHTVKGSIRLDQLALAPLVPWLIRAGWPDPPRQGAVSASLSLEMRHGPGGWEPGPASGEIRADRVTAGIPGLPCPLTDMTGTARVEGSTVRLGPVALKTDGIPWKVSGTIENPAVPRLKLGAATTAFSLGSIARGGRGTGNVTLEISGPAASPTVIAVADLGAVAWHGVSFDRVTGTAEILGGGLTVNLRSLDAISPAGNLKLKGTVKTRRPEGDLDWEFIPSDPDMPRLTGSLALAGSQVRASARTRDGVWALSGTGRSGADGSWQIAVTGKSPDGARASVEGAIGPAPARKLQGSVSVVKTTVAGLYLDRRNDVLRRLGAVITATGRISGTAADAALKASLAGSALKLPGRLLTVSAGSLSLSRAGLELSRVTLPDGSAFDLVFPFGGKPVTARLDAAKLPLGAVWAAFPPEGGGTSPGALRETEGFLNGSLSATDLAVRPAFDGNGEVRELKWRGRNLGILSFAASAVSGKTAVSRIKLNGPDCSAEGSGTFETRENGWEGAGKFTIAYLRFGSDDLDAVAELTASGKDGTVASEIRLTDVRINALAYPDFSGTYSREGPGRMVIKASWEDLLSAVLRLEGGATGGRTVSLTAALSELPLAPVCGAISAPAPADKMSGSVTLKGPVDRASMTASLNWGRGEGDMKGWVDATGRHPCSLALTLSDGAFLRWIAFARAIGAPSWLPDADGRVETRGLTLEYDGGTALVNGWIRFRDLTVRGRRAGSGSLRIKTSPGGGEMEGSLENEGASFSLNPTRFTGSGGTITATGAFGWRGIPVGKTTLSLSRAEFSARLSREKGNVNLSLTGLALGDLEPAALKITAVRSGKKWAVQSPEESEWKLLGSLAATGLKFETVEDARTGERWLVARGPGGASMRLDCAMTPPDEPERFVLEARKFPAAPVLLALGLPPLGGRADADLAWRQGGEAPLAGRLALAGCKWGDIPLDLIEIKGHADPGRSFGLESVRAERAGELAATGSGSLRLVPDNVLSLTMVVQGLSLGYLKPFGFVEESDAAARGQLVFAGDPAGPGIDGTLTCTPGSFKAPAVFTDLKLAEGRAEFRGNRVSIKAVLNDVAGAAVVVAGEATHSKFAPDTFSIAFSAPAAVRVDGLPRLFRGSAKGTVRFEGTIEKPALKGEITIIEGRLQSPPKRPKAKPPSLLDRLAWDLKVRFGDGVDYAIEPVAGAPVKIARLSSRSRIYVRGAGDDMKIYGEVLADSGPIKLFLGRQLWKKMPAE